MFENFTKSQLEKWVSNVLNLSFQTFMGKAEFAHNAQYRNDINDLYFKKKEESFAIIKEYWTKIRGLNKKYTQENFKIFENFFQNNLSLVKENFELFVKGQPNSNTKDSIDLLNESFFDNYKHNEGFCHDSFEIMKETVEKLNNIVEEFQRNVAVVIDKYKNQSNQSQTN